MKPKPKSQRRRVKDATIVAELAGPYNDPRLKLMVHPIGRPDHTVAFEIPFWMWSRLRKDVVALGVDAAQRHMDHARIITEATR